MGFLISFFNLILYQPLFNILILFYQYLPGKDFGLAVIFLTLLIKISLSPLEIKATKIQKSLSELQPKIKEIQEKHKNDKQKQTLETLELYKKEKINPFSGLFISLIQVPILIALWMVFQGGLHPEKLANLYSFIPHPGLINPVFFGFLNLAQPSAILAVFAGISQFFQTKMLSSKTLKTSRKEKESSQFSDIMGKQVLYFFPFLTFFILLKLPAAIGLYWLVAALFSIIQQSLIFKKRPHFA